MRILVLWPTIVVVISGSEDTSSPFKLHVILSGLSPDLILHVTCTNSPSLAVSSPNENGVIVGGTERKGDRLRINILIKKRDFQRVQINI